MAWNFTSQCLFSCGAGNRPATGHDLYPFSETPSLFFILLNSFPLDRRCRVHFHLEEVFSSIRQYVACVTKARTFSLFSFLYPNPLIHRWQRLCLFLHKFSYIVNMNLTYQHWMLLRVGRDVASILFISLR